LSLIFAPPLSSTFFSLLPLVMLRFESNLPEIVFL